MESLRRFESAGQLEQPGPVELLELLEIGGKLVIPAGNEGEQKLYVITKISDTENEEIIHEDVAFVPMLPGISNGEI